VSIVKQEELLEVEEELAERTSGELDEEGNEWVAVELSEVLEEVPSEGSLEFERYELEELDEQSVGWLSNAMDGNSIGMDGNSVGELGEAAGNEAMLVEELPEPYNKVLTRRSSVVATTVPLF